MTKVFSYLVSTRSEAIFVSVFVTFKLKIAPRFFVYFNSHIVLRKRMESLSQISKMDETPNNTIV